MAQNSRSVIAVTLPLVEWSGTVVSFGFESFLKAAVLVPPRDPSALAFSHHDRVGGRLFYLAALPGHLYGLVLTASRTASSDWWGCTPGLVTEPAQDSVSPARQLWSL